MPPRPKRACTLRTVANIRAVQAWEGLRKNAPELRAIARGIDLELRAELQDGRVELSDLRAPRSPDVMLASPRTGSHASDDDSYESSFVVSDSECTEDKAWTEDEDEDEEDEDEGDEDEEDEDDEDAARDAAGGDDNAAEAATEDTEDAKEDTHTQQDARQDTRGDCPAGPTEHATDTH